MLAETESAASARQKRHVLVTDDEPITRMLVKVLLEREHFQVLEATNGREAVEIATRERPDLLLIDLNMPEVDGYEAIGRLRRDLSLATLPIVVITAEDGPGIERRVLDLGATTTSWSRSTRPFCCRECRPCSAGSEPWLPEET